MTVLLIVDFMVVDFVVGERVEYILTSAACRRGAGGCGLEGRGSEKHACIAQRGRIHGHGYGLNCVRRYSDNR